MSSGSTEQRGDHRGSGTTGGGRPGSRRVRSRRLIRRIDIRLTAWFSLVFLITSSLLFGLTMWNLYRTLVNEDRQALQNRVLGHWARFQAAVSEEAGIVQLINDIESETMVVGDRPYFIRIATANNDDVYVRIPLAEWQFAFELDTLMAGVEPHAAGFMTVPSEILGYDLEVIGFPLSENFVIQIGMDTANRDQIIRLLQTSFLFTFAILFGLSVLGGLFFTSRSLKPIGTLSAAIKSIVETGELGQRIESAGSKDDLDELVHSFNHMLDRVEQLVHGMRDALDAVAHDLRTPMTRFRATAEQALAQPGDAAGMADALGAALEESDQILRMLNSMMDISEADAGAMSLRREEVDAARLVAEVADVYSVVAEEAGVAIRTDLDDGIMISADPGRLRQAVGNLVDNAVKYAPRDTEVVLALGTSSSLPEDAARELDPEGRDDGRRYARICVHNEGAGIPPEEISHIWTRLYRGSDGKRSAGLGLGLTLVRAIVEAHGGAVEVESEPGEYAEFRIYLPLAET